MVKHSTLGVQNSPLGTANTEEAQSKIIRFKMIIHHKGAYDYDKENNRGMPNGHCSRMVTNCGT